MIKLPLSRLILILALLMASGLFSLRAYSLLTDTSAMPASSLAEQDLTHLIETLVGTDKVRVAIQPAPPKSYLILINGDRAPIDIALQSNIETILSGAQGFNPETDKLTIEQYPFARTAGNALTDQEALEVIGLFVLLCLIAVASITQKAVTKDAVQIVAQDGLARPDQNRSHTDMAAPNVASTPEAHKAAHITQTDPDHAVKLLRSWMNGSEGRA